MDASSAPTRIGVSSVLRSSGSLEEGTEYGVTGGPAGWHGASTDDVEQHNDAFAAVAAWKSVYRDGAMRSLITRLLTLSL